jgi:hypothetical protein
MELSKNDANLLTREGVIFISKKLGEIDFEIENEMLVALRRRISERRNKDTVWITMMNFVLPTNCLQSQWDHTTFIWCTNKESANISEANIPAAKTSSAGLCSIATADMTLSNELQNAMAAVSVVQTSTLKTAK